MAAAAPVPVPVDSPAGAPTADCPIYLAANSDVVLSTPSLDWQPAPAGPGGGARVQLKSFQAVKAFLPRCKTARTAADQAAALAVNALTFRLTDACWSRILTELTAAQIFAKTAHSIDELHDAIRDAVIPTPANLDLIAGDWRNAEAFALPAADLHPSLPTQPPAAGAHAPLRGHRGGALHVAFLPIRTRHRAPRRQRAGRHDHAHLQVDVPGVPPRLSTNGNPRA